MPGARRRRRGADRDAAVQAAASRETMRELEQLVHEPIREQLSRAGGWEAVNVRATQQPDGTVALELRYGEEHGIGKLVMDQVGGGAMVPWPDCAELDAEAAASSAFRIELLGGWLLAWAENRTSDEALTEAQRLVGSAR